MSSVDLAAAQQRVLARREAKSREEATRLHVQRSTNATTALSRLPFPVGSLNRRLLDVWDTFRGRTGTNPIFRVGQVDAELLDEELLELLSGQVGDSLKYFRPHIKDDWSQEVTLVLRAVLFKLSIWDHNSSYGATLQDLRYIDARRSDIVGIPPSRSQKVLYGVVTVFGRYGWNKWEEWLIGHEEPSARDRLLSKFTSYASNIHSVAAFVSFLIFLVNGRYRTLTDRLLRIRLAPPTFQIRREVSFEHLNRQLVWHAFTEFLLFLLPLVGVRRWRRWISRAWRRTVDLVREESTKEDTTRCGELAFLPERTCAICYHDQNPAAAPETDVAAGLGASGGVVGSAQTDVTNPYQTSCGCIYCFVCIATKLEAEEGQGWVCLRCGRQVKECRPWGGDVEEVASTVSAFPAFSGQENGAALKNEAIMSSERDDNPSDKVTRP